MKCYPNSTFALYDASNIRVMEIKPVLQKDKQGGLEHTNGDLIRYINVQ